MNTEERRPTSNFDTVDLLRGTSIIAVILIHIAVLAPFAKVSLLPNTPAWVTYPLFWNGINAVKVFFVLSGFLITMTSLKRFGSLAELQPSRFYRLRFARIAPLLLLVLALLSALHLLHVPGFTLNTQKVSLTTAIIGALTFTINWVMAWRGFLPMGWDVLWSLSVEEMFYFVFPVVCLLMRPRKNLKPFVLVLLAFVVMGPFARTVWTTNVLWQLWSYLGAMDGIAIGCLTALLTHHLQQRGRQSKAVLNALQVGGVALMLVVLLWPHVPGLPLIGPAFTHSLRKTGLDGTILYLGTAMVALASALRGKTGTIWTAPLRWCGRLSYEIYLTHQFVLMLAIGLFQQARQRDNFPLWMAGMVLVSLATGWIFARFYTGPLNEWIRGAGLPSVTNEYPEMPRSNQLA